MPRASAAKTDENAIREHAYYLWEQDGRPSGRDVDFWLRAVTELTPKPKARGRAAAAPAAPSRSRKAR